MSINPIIGPLGVKGLVRTFTHGEQGERDVHKTIAAICGALLLACGGAALGALPGPEDAEPNAIMPTDGENWDTSITEGFACDESAGCSCDACRTEFPVCDQCCYSTTRCYFSAEALFLNLNSGTRGAEPVVLNQDTQQTVLSTRSVPYDTVAGPRLTLGFQVNPCGTIETSYFGLHDWNSSDVARGNNNLRIPGDLAFATQDFFDADQMRIRSSSRLNNAEVNYLRRTGFEYVTLLAGFRYLNLSETFGINAADLDAGQSSDYNIQASNYLFGGQFGGRWRKYLGDFGLDFVGKAGVFGNAAQQHTFVGDFDNSFTLRNSTTHGSRTAFVGELGFNGTWHLTKMLYARVGYTLLWVEGLARATDQLDFTDTPQSGTGLVFGKGAFLHGASAGLEARW